MIRERTVEEKSAEDLATIFDYKGRSFCLLIPPNSF